MIPELFRIGSFSVSPFGVMLVLALLGAYWQLRRGMLARGLGSEDDASSIVFACGFVGILGGKIYYAILVQDWGMIFDRAGIVWYGCLIGGALAFFFTLHRRRLPVWPVLDAAGPALAFGYGIGRIGCLLVGDDYGRPTDLPWAMEFPKGLPPTTAGVLRGDFGLDIDPSLPADTVLAVHPTQIYSSLASFAIFFFALRLAKKPMAAGNLFLIVMALLSVERFLVEFVRAKDDRFFSGFTLAQVISVLILILLGAVALYRRRRAEA